jgi:hypothetical protein
MRTIIRSRTRFAVLTIALAAAAAATSGVAQADYLGERLDTTEIEITSFTCDPQGTSTVNFTTSGVATGPYAGTFSATGSFTLGPQNQPGFYVSDFLSVGNLTSFSESLIINSGASPVAFLATGPVNVFAPARDLVYDRGVCAQVEGVTLGGVTNATGMVILLFSTIGMQVTGTTFPPGTFTTTIAVKLFISSSSVGPFTAGGFDQIFFCCADAPPSDTSAPTINVPESITVDATGPAGAVVNYVVSANDPDDATSAVNLACAPASGSVFAIATTIVSCLANDPAGNTSSATFLVRVRGAADQLESVVESTQGVGPGKSFSAKASNALAAVQAGDTAGACGMLKALINEALAQSGKKLNATAANALIDRAKQIRSVLAC